jgi:hypothetical protein
MALPSLEESATAHPGPGTEPGRRTPAWGRRSSDKGWPPGGAALGCRIIELPRITDPRGNLTFIEGGLQVPFDIARVVSLYDVPGGATRGGHAHHELQQVIIAVAGSFDVVVDDGIRRERFSLNRSYYGLYVPPMVWREVEDFSSGSVSLVVASHAYDESDYYRDYDEFVLAAAAARAGAEP